MSEPWFKTAFEEHYLTLYAHRSASEAQKHFSQIVQLAQLDGVQGSILDLGCGNGRYSEVLREHGHHVVGLDFSDVLLRNAQHHHPKEHWVRGNMLHLPFKSSFERVLSLFTSFGYFDSDADNHQVLANMGSALQEGGLLYLDFLNPAQVKAADWSTISNNSLTIKSKKSFDHDLNMVFKDVEVYKENILMTKYQERVKLLDIKWFNDHAEEIGLQLIRVYGDYYGSEYSNDSPRQVMIFEK
jgi:SAM-dependent methyltransferase